jgi:hypothetical protein
MCRGAHQQHHGGCCHSVQACGCGAGHHFQRRFPTDEERIAQLEAYLHELQAEAKAVQEHLGALRG